MKNQRSYQVPSRKRAGFYLFVLYLALSLFSIVQQKEVPTPSPINSTTFQAKILATAKDQFRPSIFLQIDFHNTSASSLKNTTGTLLAIVKQNFIDTCFNKQIHPINWGNHLSLESILISIRILRI